MRNLFLSLLTVTALFAQEKNPETILDQVKTKFQMVDDYVAEATINVDVNFLKVPESKATVYFKQPDKLKLDSDGFALLPKRGLNFSPSMLLEKDFTAIYIKEDTLRGHDVHVIKVIPNNDTSDIVLSTLWIDKPHNVVRKIETTTKRQGTITLNFEYDKQIDYALPSEIKFSFKVEDMQLPAAMTGDLENDNRRGRKRNGPMVGTVTVKYDNYRVNKGLEDKIFEEKEETD